MNLHVAAAIKGVVMMTEGDSKNFLSFLPQHQQLDKKKDREKSLQKINHCHLFTNRTYVEKERGKLQLL